MMFGVENYTMTMPQWSQLFVMEVEPAFCGIKEINR